MPRPAGRGRAWGDQNLYGVPSLEIRRQETLGSPGTDAGGPDLGAEVPTWRASSQDGHDSEQDRDERKRTPPMLPERSDALSALSPSPEQTEHNQDSPDNATDQRHVRSLARERQNERVRLAFAGLSPMELAGLEPATSWVRFAGNTSPVVSMLRYWPTYAVQSAVAFAAVRHLLSPLLDQNLTKNFGHSPASEGSKAGQAGAPSPSAGGRARLAL